MRFVHSGREVVPTFYYRNGAAIHESGTLRRLFGLFTRCVSRMTWGRFALERKSDATWKVSDGDRSFGIALTVDGEPVNTFGAPYAMPPDAELSFQTEFEIPYVSHSVVCKHGFAQEAIPVRRDVWTLIEELQSINVDNVAVHMLNERMTVKRVGQSVFLHCEANGRTFTRMFPARFMAPSAPEYIPSAASLHMRLDSIDADLAAVREKYGL